VLPKPFATAIEGLAWLYSSQERNPVYGLSLVLLVWTNGTLRVPVGLRLWRRGGASKYALALEWLSYARHRLGCRSAYVLFEVVVSMLCCSSGEVVVAYEIFDGTDMIGELLGKR
jgi:hypothetical protein